MLKKLEELLEINKEETKPTRVGVVVAEDTHSLEAVLDERLKQVITPVLIGNSLVIMQQLAEIPLPADHVEIIHTYSVEEAAKKGAELAQSGQIDVLMKGQLATSQFLKPVVNKQYGLVESRLLSHIVVFELPTYPKLLITSDGGMIPEPTLEQKHGILENALEVAYVLGKKVPKVAVLAASESVNQKINSSVEASVLAKDYTNKPTFPCEIDGPISLDLALSKEVAELKHYSSNVAGEADVLLAPDMTAMNLLGKSFTVIGKGQMAGIIYGAKVPIVMTSRGSSSDEKFYSLLLAKRVSQRSDR